MTIRLRWIPSFSGSVAHATVAVLSGRTLADRAVADAISEHSRALESEIASSGLPRDRFLRHLTALAPSIDSNRELAQRAIIKTVGAAKCSDALVSRLAGHIADLEAAFRQVRPDVADQLSVRAEPLKLQWEARGPGLLVAMARLTDPGLFVSEADVVLVQPVLGGGGAAHLLTNSVRIEALLANPHEDLPEVLRLVWLLSQLNLDVPIYSENVSQHDLPRLGSLAMIPPVLAASEEVELARLSPETIAKALLAWHVVPQGETATAAQLSAVLGNWWQTYLTSPPRWAIALAALQQMVDAANRS